MDSIRTAILSACLTALGLTFAEHILPMERFERQIRLIFAVLMTTAILKPLTNLDFSPLYSDETADSFTSDEICSMADQARAEAVCESVMQTLNRELAEHKVPCRVTAVDAHITENGSIDITEVQTEGNLLTGRVYLLEWLGGNVRITEGGKTD